MMCGNVSSEKYSSWVEVLAHLLLATGLPFGPSPFVLYFCFIFFSSFFYFYFFTVCPFNQSILLLC